MSGNVRFFLWTLAGQSRKLMVETSNRALWCGENKQQNKQRKMKHYTWLAIYALGGAILGVATAAYIAKKNGTPIS